jgi:hypothetical protein
MGTFWPAVLIGLRHYVHSGFYVGIIDTAALLLATFGFYFLREEEIGGRKAVIDALSIFLGLNLLFFEIQLYFNPYPNYWWTHQAADWIAMIGLGNVVTNEFVFIVAGSVVSLRLLAFVTKI